jgi:hypothetical protein
MKQQEIGVNEGTSQQAVKNAKKEAGNKHRNK